MAGFGGNGAPTANKNVLGNVLVNLNAPLTSMSVGINAFNFGIGNVTVTTSATGTVNAIGSSGGDGIDATINNPASPGNVSVTTNAAVTSAIGNGILAATLGNGRVTATVWNDITARRRIAKKRRAIARRCERRSGGRCAEQVFSEHRNGGDMRC